MTLHVPRQRIIESAAKKTAFVDYTLAVSCINLIGFGPTIVLCFKYTKIDFKGAVFESIRETLLEISLRFCSTIEIFKIFVGAYMDFQLFPRFPKTIG